MLHSALRTPHSALSTQHAARSTQHAGTSTQVLGLIPNLFGISPKACPQKPLKFPSVAFGISTCVRLCVSVCVSVCVLCLLVCLCCVWCHLVCLCFGFSFLESPKCPRRPPTGVPCLLAVGLPWEAVLDISQPNNGALLSQPSTILAATS